MDMVAVSISMDMVFAVNITAAAIVAGFNIVNGYSILSTTGKRAEKSEVQTVNMVAAVIVTASRV